MPLRFLRGTRRPPVPEHPLLHQRMCGIEYPFDGGRAVALFALRNEPLGEFEIAKNGARIRPLPEEIVVLEEMIVAEGGVRDHQRLQRHGVFLHQVGDAGVGVDDQLIGEPAAAFSIQIFLAQEVLAEGPVLVHQRHADGRVGVEHLLRRNHLDLVGIDVEAQIVERDRRHRVICGGYPVKSPVRPLEQMRHVRHPRELPRAWRTGGGKRCRCLPAGRRARSGNSSTRRPPRGKPAIATCRCRCSRRSSSRARR